MGRLVTETFSQQHRKRASLGRSCQVWEQSFGLRPLKLFVYICIYLWFAYFLLFVRIY
jgi:hypothetical protein